MPTKGWWYSASKKIWQPGVIIGLPYAVDVPTGWSVYSDADGYFLIGTTSDVLVKTTDSRSTVEYYSSSDGGHNQATAYGGAWIYHWGYWDGVYGSGYNYRNAASTAIFDHRHLVTVTYRPPANILKLIQAGASATNPGGAVMFGTEANASQSLYSLFNDNTSAFLMADTATTVGPASETAVFSNGGASHDHIDNVSNQKALANDGDSVKTSIAAGGAAHTHPVTPSVNPALKQAIVRAFLLVDTAQVRNLIGMYDGAGCPDGWEVVAGFDGRFLRFSSSATGQVGGDNTIAISGSSSNYGHSHSTSGSSGAADSSYYKHTNTHYHSHTIGADEEYLPERFYIKFIKYTG